MPWNYTLDCPVCHETYWSGDPYGICEVCQIGLFVRSSKSPIAPVSPETLTGKLPIKVDPNNLDSASAKISDLIWPGEGVPLDPFNSWMDLGLTVSRLTKSKPVDILILLNLIVCEGEER